MYGGRSWVYTFGRMRFIIQSSNACFVSTRVKRSVTFWTFSAQRRPQDRQLSTEHGMPKTICAIPNHDEAVDLFTFSDSFVCSRPMSIGHYPFAGIQITIYSKVDKNIKTLIGCWLSVLLVVLHETREYSNVVYSTSIRWCILYWTMG